MADKRTSWINGDVLEAVDLKESILVNRWYKAITSKGDNFFNAQFRGVAGHSSGTMSVILSDGDIWVTTDNGTNWVEKNTTMSSSPFFIKNQKTDRTRAIAVENGASADTSFTTNSGATWTDGGDLSAQVTTVYDLSVPTATLAVVGVADSNGDNIQRSVDGGATWVDATTSPDKSVFAVDMFDGTFGFALTADGEIWKTVDGADTWTDTTHTALSTTLDDTIWSGTSSSSIIINKTDKWAYIYDGTQNAYSLISTPSGMPGSFFKLTNGYVYFAVSSTSGISLFKTNDNGGSFSISPMPYQGSVWTTKHNKGTLSEGANNTLLLLTSNNPFSNIIKVIEAD